MKLSKLLRTHLIEQVAEALDDEGVEAEAFVVERVVDSVLWDIREILGGVEENSD